ncbi:MAG: DNRLRE domain-containing protein [Lachnospiraceae bacterium]|nr:DNRLRE domain-containing protein [Lachnospiraceae bacterium]
MNHLLKRIICAIIITSMLLGIVAVNPSTATAAPANEIDTLETQTGVPGEVPVDAATPAEEVSGVKRADNITERTQPADPDPEGTASAAEVYEAEVMSEDMVSRDRYHKDFLLEDMSCLAVTYPEAVHFESENGWEDIDNTLSLYGEEGNEVWRNKANSVSMELPAVLTKDNGPRITFEGDSLGFCFVGTSGDESVSVAATPAEINNDLISKEILDSMTARQRKILPTHLSSQAAYRNILPDTDLIYTADSARLKETIIIYTAPKDAENDLTYVFNLAKDDNTYRLEEDGSVTVINEKGEEVFEIEAPYAKDAAGDYCRDISVSLEEGENGYILTYTINSEWLAEEERAYPVSIDPTVGTKKIRQNIKDKTVCSGGDSYTHYNDDALEVGKRSGRGIERTLMRFLSIPQLTSADAVIAAYVDIYRDTSSDTTVQMNVHRATSSWDSTNVYWSNQPSFSSTVTDYNKVGAAGWYSFYITEIARRWYAEANYGIVIKAPDSVENGSGAYRTLCSSDYSTEALRPIFVVNYRNNCGYESYWDYDSFDAGRAGSAGINLFTGNAVIQRTDMGFDGERMPVNITFTYNANDKDTDSFGFGYGWRSNLNQKVYLFTPSDQTSTGGYTYYIWEDGDGTRHYFMGVGETGTFNDEDGLDLTMTVSGSDATRLYIITDKQGGRSIFDKFGKLWRIYNNQQTESYIEITHTSTSLINTVTDGAGRKYRFTYTNGRLTQLQYNGTGSTDIYYTGYSYDGSGNLTGVTFVDNGSAAYQYSGHLLTSMQDSADHKLTLSYDISGSYLPCRTVSVRTYEGINSSSYAATTYTYNDCYTLATDCNGKTLQYQFNSFGNTVSVQDDGGRALYAKYATDTSSSGKRNQLDISSKLQTTTNNMIKNPSFEGTTHWNVSVGTGATGSYGYTSANPGSSIPATTPYIGEKCYYLKKDNADGFLEVKSGTGMSFKSSTAYTVSAYIKTTSFTSGRGVIIGANINGSTTFDEGISSPGQWQRFELSFTTPAETVTSYHIYFRLYSQGTVFIDCVQIEENGLASRFNLIENSDFRHWQTDTSTPYGWSKGGNCTSSDIRKTLSSGYITAPGVDANVWYAVGSADVGKVLWEDAIVLGDAGDCFSIGGWAKGNSVPLKSGRNTFFGIILRFYYADNTTKEFIVHFNSDLYSDNTWQYACERVVAEKAYTKIRIFLRYDYTANSACFDAVQLFKDEFGSSYVYDSNGNITSVTDSRKRSNTYEYQSNNLTKATLPDGAEYTYSYDNWHNVSSATSAENVKNYFTYDAYGNNNSVSVGYTADDTNHLKIKSTAEYTNSGNDLYRVTDSIGNTVTYGHDTDTSVLISAAGGGSTTHYGYDGMYRLNAAVRNYTTGGSTATASLSYTYSNDRLSTITYGGTDPVTYSLYYGVFGNLTSVSAGGSTLITNTYGGASTYYQLTSSAYANGGSVSYGYDTEGKLISKTFDGGDTIKYIYDNEGKVGITDYSDYISPSETVNTRTRYLYDLSGRLISTIESGSRNFKSTYSFDTRDNLSAVTDIIEGTVYSSEYAYDTDNRNTVSSGGGGSTQASYDTYGRKSGETVKHGTSTVNSVSIGYYSPSSEMTSLLPSSYVNTHGTNTTGYSYSYDSYGNISSVTGSDGYAKSYRYDELGQLVREDFQKGGYTLTYSYDNRGNLLSKTVHAYTTADNVGPATGIIEYEYQNGVWSDILTKAGGVAYQNDAIGNRTRDGIWEYSWEHGRQLKHVNNHSGSVSIDYTYGADGLRRSRTVTYGGSTTTYNYYYRDGKLVEYSWPGTVLHYYYDGNGQPYHFTVNGSQNYYLVRNAQGDVTAITDSSGTVLAAYEYDAWGKLVSTTGTYAGTLGIWNQLRYRGYVYDADTGLYYLQSRYYDPNVGRFISADDTSQLGNDGEFTSYNLFLYCNNNPVCLIDIDGNKPQNILDGLDYPCNPFLYLLQELFFKEHHKRGSTNPSNRSKHEEGNARRNRDSGNEKGDQRRKNRSNKRNRTEKHEKPFTDTIKSCVLIAGSIVAVTVIVLDDITVVGAADDVAIAPIVGVFIKEIQSLIN